MAALFWVRMGGTTEWAVQLVTNILPGLATSCEVRLQAHNSFVHSLTQFLRVLVISISFTIISIATVGMANGNYLMEHPLCHEEADGIAASKTVVVVGGGLAGLSGDNAMEYNGAL